MSKARESTQSAGVAGAGMAESSSVPGDGGHDASRSFIGLPRAETVDLPFSDFSKVSSPVLTGLPLHIGSSLVASSAFIQRYFWHDSGLARLRDHPHLVHAKPRNDPSVIPVASGTTTSNAYDPTSPRCVISPPEISGEHFRFYTAADYHRAYTSGEFTPTDVVEALLPLITRPEGKYSIGWIEVRPEIIREAAAASTKRWKSGAAIGPLDGVPTAVKDEVDLKGYRRCDGSKITMCSAEDAQTSYCVEMWENAGALVLGKLNMHELGLDTTNNNPNFGTPRNPYNQEYYTGGSSGGSGFAVGSGLVPFALGADGGGSVRVPSAHCGLYGLKPSHGRVSGRPTPSLSPSVVVLGPIAATMSDLELAYRVMAAPDPQDPVSAKFAPPAPMSSEDIGSGSKLLGICRPWFDVADPVVKSSCQKAIDYLVNQHGYKVVDISIPLLHEGQIGHTVTIMSEIAAGWTHSPSELTDPNKILVSVATQASAVDYVQAQKIRGLLMQHIAKLYKDHPGMIIVTPTMPFAGHPIPSGGLAYGVSDGATSVRSMNFVYLANFIGCPALTAPIAYAEPSQGEGNVPLGLMGMAHWGDEEELLSFGKDLEQFLVASPASSGRLRPPAWEDVIGLVKSRSASIAE